MSLTLRSPKFSELAQGSVFAQPDGRILIKLYEPTPAGENAVMLKGSTEGKLYQFGPDDPVAPMVLA